MWSIRYHSKQGKQSDIQSLNLVRRKDTIIFRGRPAKRLERYSSPYVFSLCLVSKNMSLRNKNKQLNSQLSKPLYLMK